MAERNILAYFNSPEAAEGVSKKLKALRVSEVSVDRFSKYPGDGEDRIMNPITGDFSGLGSLTLDADYTNASAAILSAADPSASGLSDAGQEEISGRDILLTAIVDESQYEQAIQVIQSGGGSI